MKDGHMKLGDFGLAIDATVERPKSRVGTVSVGAVASHTGVRSSPCASVRRACARPLAA
jgi:hypothetical protein